MTSQTTPPEPIVALPLAAFVQTALTATERVPETAAAVVPAGAEVPLRRTALVNAIAARSATNAVATVELLSARPTPDVIGELSAMQAAFVRQLWKIDQDWRAGMMRIVEGALSLRSANTLSKIMEQELNLVGQCGDLTATYVTSTAALIENTSVGYSFWLSQKVKEMHAATAAEAQGAP
ncbi:hypothetical protein [Methylobacterium nonmethylotrophicum]|uniref:Phasin domain-containing protein n=1 Tax=Methylobacterium nonmethylotrophicum TaxID=1141884 RepID=A0A4Z0NTA0_9HYPH|nr:hypothetical protein [Methylobacterium nonmethylotrophicum]TGD99847.1 hypothetical protein EU555_11855 [Methylobacterium nonmethylotrophicum]